MKKLLILLLIPNIYLTAKSFEKKLDKPLKLPHDFHVILSVEMFELQGKMNLLLEGISRGKWKMVESTADYISDNYILKQKMTYKEKKMLKKALPDGFVALDKYFHQTAKELKEAATKKESGLVLEKYRHLIKTCMECHGRYAAYKFIDFQGYEVPATVPKNFYKHLDDWR
ncbi:MAG: hypothetical protein DRQ88_02060 [Epsilonproteobacteria bacterium]|nr:MAG: hypothetical protein DRQ89_00805 [Campylobacterota bacterium]RLA67647.1 MAG: hypothetical protein DRQ88_02060 [Campylobacterota bacterium]